MLAILHGLTFFVGITSSRKGGFYFEQTDIQRAVG